MESDIHKLFSQYVKYHKDKWWHLHTKAIYNNQIPNSSPRSMLLYSYGECHSNAYVWRHSELLQAHNKMKSRKAKTVSSIWMRICTEPHTASSEDGLNWGGWCGRNILDLHSAVPISNLGWCTVYPNKFSVIYLDSPRQIPGLYLHRAMGTLPSKSFPIHESSYHSMPCSLNTNVVKQPTKKKGSREAMWGE
jgi:hypothetical protein